MKSASTVSGIPINIIFGLAGFALLLVAVWVGKYIRQLQAVVDLVSASPEVCYICRKDKLGHKTLEDFGEIDPAHGFMPGLLVYLPDESLR